MTLAPWPWPRVFAHRCGGQLAPENTLAGLNLAHAHGCAGVEFDVMLSGEGSPFVIHDEHLTRTTDGHGEVAHSADATLHALDAGAWFDLRFAGERIPALNYVAQRCRALGLAANIEIKPAAGHDLSTASVVALAATQLWQDAPLLPLLSSFSESALAVAADIAPQLPRGLLVETIPADWLARCRRLGAVALHVEVSQITPAWVQAIHAEGLWVVVYTENDPERAQQQFGWGVDCVITDRPDSVRADSGPGLSADSGDVPVSIAPPGVPGVPGVFA